VASGECLTTLHVDGALSSCAWLPDGARIIATGAAGAYFLALAAPGPLPDLLPFQQLAR
jgi:hypothetical protein